jgi:hypothetical protein
MVKEFPHVHFFQSLDVAPIIAHVPRRKFIFEVHDFTTGLLVEDNSQDPVFLNDVFELVRSILLQYHVPLALMHHPR